MPVFLEKLLDELAFSFGVHGILFVNKKPRLKHKKEIPIFNKIWICTSEEGVVSGHLGESSTR